MLIFEFLPTGRHRPRRLPPRAPRPAGPAALLRRAPRPSGGEPAGSRKRASGARAGAGSTATRDSTIRRQNSPYSLDTVGLHQLFWQPCLAVAEPPVSFPLKNSSIEQVHGGRQQCRPGTARVGVRGRRQRRRARRVATTRRPATTRCVPHILRSAPHVLLR